MIRKDRPMLARLVDARTRSDLPVATVLPGWDGWWRWTPEQF
jgi:hypothetical protein